MIAHLPISPANKVLQSLKRDDGISHALMGESPEIMQIENMSRAEVDAELKTLGITSGQGLYETKIMLGIIPDSEFSSDEQTEGWLRHWSRRCADRWYRARLSYQGTTSIALATMVCMLTCGAMVAGAIINQQRVVSIHGNNDEKLLSAEGKLSSALFDIQAVQKAEFSKINKQLEGLSNEFSNASNAVSMNEKSLLSAQASYGASMAELEKILPRSTSPEANTRNLFYSMLISAIDLNRQLRMKTVQSYKFEVQSGEIALNKTRSPDIRSYADRTIRDYRAANVALNRVDQNDITTSLRLGGVPDARLSTVDSWAGAEKGDLSSTADHTVSGAFCCVSSSSINNLGEINATAENNKIIFSPDQQTKLDELTAVPAGASFEKTYVKQQLEVLRTIESLIKEHTENSSSSALQHHARMILPLVQQHQEMAKRLSVSYSK